MRLYDLTFNYSQVLAMIEEGDESYFDTLESINDAIEDKAENYGKVIKSIESGIAGLKAEEQRLADRRRFMENSVKRLKTNLEGAMIAMDKPKIKGALFTFNIQNNPPRVEVTDDTVIPELFFVPQPPTIDKKGLLEELKLGRDIPGAMLVQGKSLRIK